MSGAARLTAIEQIFALGDRAPVRLITLSERQRVFAIVDPVDYDFAIRRPYNIGWKPRAAWKLYAKHNVGPNRTTVYLHREILMRADPRDEVFTSWRHADHINAQSLDNRRANLRWLTPEENRLHVTPRAQVPSVEQICAAVLAEAAREPVATARGVGGDATMAVPF